MTLQDKIKDAIVDRIIQTGYEDRVEKIARYGLDDYAGIDYTDVMENGYDRNGQLTKQAADMAILCEKRRQIVEAGYNQAKYNK